MTSKMIFGVSLKGESSTSALFLWVVTNSERRNFATLFENGEIGSEGFGDGAIVGGRGCVVNAVDRH